MRYALGKGRPVEVTDPDTQEVYVFVKQSQYQAMRRILEIEEIDPRCTKAATRSPMAITLPVVPGRTPPTRLTTAWLIAILDVLRHHGLPAMAAAITVRELRERWQPHKKRLDGLRNSHPTSVRFHRACSWLEEAERLDPERHADQMLLHQWIAFNALYGQWDLNLHEPVGDRPSWQVFLSRMLELDATGHLVTLLQENRRLVLAILGNAYLSRYFWQDPGQETAGRVRQARHRAETWYAERPLGHHPRSNGRAGVSAALPARPRRRHARQSAEPHGVEALHDADAVVDAGDAAGVDRPRRRRGLGPAVLSAGGSDSRGAVNG